MEVYILDSNFFIQAHRDSYPFDVAVSFWSKVKELASAGRIISIDKVREELYDKNDVLEDWCKENLPEDFFKDTSTVMAEYARVTSWAVSRNHYLPQALNEFLDAKEADAYIIAYCLNKPDERIVVTNEVASESKRKVKIPEPCNYLNVSYIKPIEVFRRLGVTF